MAELQLKRRSAEREAENLMTQANSEDGPLAHQIMHGFVSIGERCRIARTIGEKNPIWIKSEHFVCGCCRRHNGHLKTLLAQQAQNVFLDSIVIRGNSKSDGRKLRFAACVLRLAGL